MTNEEFIQNCHDYALGSLEGKDLAEFQTYLRTANKDELTQLAEILSTASLLPLTLERKAPPPHVKEELMKKIQLSARAGDSVQRRTFEPDVLPVPHKRSWLPFGVTTVIVVMVIGFSFYVFKLMGTIEQQNQRLVGVQTEKQQLATQIVALKNELSRKEEMLKVLSSKRIEITVMNGLDVNPVGYGKIIWDPEKKTAILQVSNLPAVPTDKDYQLWVIKGKQPISAGVFAVSNNEPNFFKITNLAVTEPKEIAAFAITLEPKGGVPAPTGAMYMAGSPKL